MSKINFFALLLTLSFTYTESATSHAVITNNSLEITPIQSGKASQVTLNFNSNIERGNPNLTWFVQATNMSY